MTGGVNMEKAPQTVIGKYKNPEDVKAALQRLQREGYKREDVTLYTNNTNLKHFEETNEVDMLADETRTVMKDKEDRSVWERVKGIISYEDSSHTASDAEKEFLTPFKEDISNGYTIIVVRDFKESPQPHKQSNQPKTETTAPLQVKPHEETEEQSDNINADEESEHSQSVSEDAFAPRVTNQAEVSSDRDKIQLKEEQLNINKEEVHTGEVSVHKETVHDVETIDVPVEREPIVVENKVDSDGASHSADALVEEDSIIIPIKEEKITVHKEPVIKEEVHIKKERVQDIEHISENVRREEIDVDTNGQANFSEKEEKPSEEF